MRRLADLLVFVLVAASFVLAQSPYASISGRIADSSKAMVVGAEVVAVNANTNVKTSTTTNGDGIYVLSNLAPGSYFIQVQKQGFRSILKPDVVLHVQDAVELNFILAVGSASESVTVEGGAPLVDTESAAVGTVIDRSFVESLPLNGRSFNTLLQLTPGVVIVPSGAGANGDPGQFSIAGQRTDANNFTVDGVSANFGVGSALTTVGSGTGTAQAFSALGGTSSLVSVEALQEFRIETSSFAPEFGRSPGGQVILTTRSGTNDLHGGVYDYFRNTIMDANNWFNKSHNPPLPRAPEHHNDFGAYLGGPLVRDKTFFFLSYEGARLRLPQSITIQVPSTYARMQASSALAPFLNAYPQPNGQPLSPTDYTAPFTGSFSNAATLDAGSVRIDHTLNDRFAIFGRYSNAPSETGTRFNGNLSGVQTTPVNTQTLTVGVNMQLRDSLVNTLRGNWSTQSSAQSVAQDPFGGSTPLNPQLLLGNLPAASSYVAFDTFDTSEFDIGTDASNRTGQMNFVDDLSWTRGTHQFKTGVDYRAIFLDKHPFHNQLLYFATSVQDFLATGQASYVIPQTATDTKFFIQALSLYWQDTWRATPRLTLTYGLRWELSPAPSGRGATSLAAWANVDNPSSIALAPPGTPLWKTTYTNLAPRLGITYRLTKKGDLVFRAGGGVFYDLGVGQAAQLGTNLPNFASGFAAGIPLPVSDVSSILPPLSQQPPFPTGTQGYSSALELPRSYQWNVAIEKSLKGGQVVSATYVAQAGRKLLRQESLFQPNSNFEGDFLLWTNDSQSNYNALQLQYRRPLSSRVQAVVNYTWSHSLDNASNDVVAALSNTVISGAADYASSDFDVRHSFSGAMTFNIPSATKSGVLSVLTRDWSLDAVAVARSGFPFNGVVLFGSPDPGGYATSRPDIVPGQPIWISDASAAGGRSLNPSAFTVPVNPRQGTEPRNDIRGFNLTQLDLSVGRQFPLTEKFRLQFRADAFNAFNHPNFANPPAFVQFGAPYLRSGQMLNQALGGLISLFQGGGPRSFQLSLKLSF